MNANTLIHNTPHTSLQSFLVKPVCISTIWRRCCHDILLLFCATFDAHFFCLFCFLSLFSSSKISNAFYSTRLALRALPQLYGEQPNQPLRYLHFNTKYSDSYMYMQICTYVKSTCFALSLLSIFQHRIIPVQMCQHYTFAYKN